MSAGLTIAQTHACVSAALADEVTAIGGIAVACAELGLSDDSIRRRLAGTHGWSAADVAALVAAGQARLGRSLVVQRLAALLDGQSAAGDGRRATDDAATTLPVLLAQAQRLASALEDRQVSRSEAREILRDLPALTLRLDQLHADLAALLRGGDRA